MKFFRYTMGMIFLGFNLSALGWDTATRAEDLSPLGEESFSIVVIPDTQQYFGADTKREPKSTAPVTNAIFESWTDWIAANIDAQNIAFVSHVGDIVDRNQTSEWTVARQCMDKLHGKVPYGLCVGNHDMEGKSGNSSLFQEFFPQSRFAGFDWYGGCFERSEKKQAVSGNNANSYQLFSACGMDFIILHLECNAPDNVLKWADGVLQTHRSRRAIITTHMDLGPVEKPQKARDYYDTPKGRMKWSKCHGDDGNTPQQMWKKCFRKHANVFLMLCGDQSRSQAYHLESTGDAGNRVYSLLSDYGVHGLRLMRFHPFRNEIEVVTWDPVKQERCRSTSIVPDEGQHQFTLEYQMAPVVSE